MSFDGVVTRSVVKELKDKLVGGRIDRIFQPEEDELALTIHSMGVNYKLLISASNDNPRIHLTEYNKKNPQTPPMFCMLLRKHLQGGIILNIEQYHMDRIIFIDVSSLDELGAKSEIRLAVEIMGRHSNIILIDKEKEKILDSILRITEDVSRVRQTLPGLPYTFPPLQDKKNPLYTNKDEFLNLISKEKESLPIFKFFYFNYLGFSPIISREICYRANIDSKKTIKDLDDIEIDTLGNSLLEIIKDMNSHNYEPMYISQDGEKIEAFYCFNLKQFDGLIKTQNQSISHIIDYTHFKNGSLNKINQKAQIIKKTIQTSLDRAENKLSKQKDELLASKDREKFKIYADLISANFHRIERGLKEIELENFYDENMAKIIVPLDIKLSPGQNADRYYKRYSKLKNAEKLLTKMIPNTKHEIDYLENVVVSIDNTSEVEDLEEINQELIREGYIQDKTKGKKKKKQKSLSKPHHYKSKDGFDIFVGKNNRQNDELTLKTSNRHDIWLHVQNMPGSHVIIRKDSPDIDVPETTLEEASILAAYYSKGKNGVNVPVDYTERYNVKKAKGAKPGMVFYEDFKTIFVNPSTKLINTFEKVN